MSSVLGKSSFKGRDIAKKKIIRKNVKVIKNENIEDAVCNNHKEEKHEKERLLAIEPKVYGKHEGKENKLQQ